MNNVIKLDTSINKQRKLSKIDKFLGNHGKVISPSALETRRTLIDWTREFEKTLTQHIKIQQQRISNKLKHVLDIAQKDKREKYKVIKKNLVSLEFTDEHDSYDDIDLSWYKPEE